MKKIAAVSLVAVTILMFASQVFALVDLNAGKYICNEKEMPEFNHLLKGGLK